MADFHKKQQVKAFRKEESKIKVSRRLDSLIAFSGESKDSLIDALGYWSYIKQTGIVPDCDCGCGGYDIDHNFLYKGVIVAKALYR